MAWFNMCVLLGLLLLSDLGCKICVGFGKFGFDIHHRFSDSVKRNLPVDELPEKGSLEYYVAMVNRDRIIRSRRLAMVNDQTRVTFLNGNETHEILSLGHLQYANVSVGEPPLSYLVALDTGSSLFWLPCDCTSCVHSLLTLTGEIIDINIYNPNASSTSSKVSCHSTMCGKQGRCSSDLSSCSYGVHYKSPNTSSTGILVEDVLHLTIDDEQSKVVDAWITFGCGQVQTGLFLNGLASGGLLGLGMDDVSVPSILAKKGLASNSFSMCFGPDGTGRISFGDKGSSGQGETPFDRRQSHHYKISFSHINVGGNAVDLEFNAMFDSGTAFTHLSDPAYTFISESFNSLAIEKRHSFDSFIPFEYCYDISSNQSSMNHPTLNLTMKGGDNFHVIDPTMSVSHEGGNFSCLGIIKSEDLNIIGYNFMTGYRVVFDRERLVLGWKASDCYDIEDTLPPDSTAIPTFVHPVSLSLALFLSFSLVFLSLH